MDLESELEAGESAVFGVAFIEDREVFLAAACADGSVRLWADDGTPVGSLEGHASRVLAIAWSPTSRIVATGGADCRVCIWNLHRRELVHTLTDHRDWVRHAAFSPKGEYLATASDNEQLLIWRVADLVSSLTQSSEQT